MLKADKTDRVARLVLGVRALKQKQNQARARSEHHPVGTWTPIADLAATLLDGPGRYSGPGDTQSKNRDRCD